MPYNGIDFSPSGTFYFRRRSPNYGRFDLFESKTNVSLLSSSRVLPAFVPQAIGWLTDEDLLLFDTWYYGGPGVAQEVPHSILYDPRSDTSTDLGEQALLGFDGTGTAVVWEKGRFDKVPNKQLKGGTR